MARPRGPYHSSLLRLPSPLEVEQRRPAGLRYSAPVLLDVAAAARRLRPRFQLLARAGFPERCAHPYSERSFSVHSHVARSGFACPPLGKGVRPSFTRDRLASFLIKSINYVGLFLTCGACVRSVTVIIQAFQAWDPGSTPGGRTCIFRGCIKDFGNSSLFWQR